MYKREMTMEVSGNPHKPGDIININGERWMVVSVNFNYFYSTVRLEPLTDVMAASKIVRIGTYECTIADYIKMICDEYEYDCQG
jgi:hypothetical protein